MFIFFSVRTTVLNYKMTIILSTVNMFCFRNIYIKLEIKTGCTEWKHSASVSQQPHVGRTFRVVR